MGKLISAILFIAGICIGIAYFSIPILTGVVGFIPGTLMTVIVWLFTLAISLLYAEATLTQPDGSNLATISRALLGKTWMTILTVIFIINLLTFLASYAYIAADIIQWLFQIAFNVKIPSLVAEILSTAPFCLIVFLGVQFSFRFNTILMIGLLASFVLMCLFGKDSVVSSRLYEQHWTYIIFAVPILFSALGFAGIIPVICSYLDRNPRNIRIAMCCGSALPMLVYIVWQWFLMGSFAPGKFWVLYEKKADLEAVIALAKTIPNITYTLNFLIFFSMTTSLLGNGVSLVEFLCDLFKIPLGQRKGPIRLGLCCAVYGITTLAALFNGQFFITLIQKIITPLGAILINGLIPIFMVIQSRYVHKIDSPHLLRGGRTALFVLGLCLVILIYLEGVGFISS